MSTVSRKRETAETRQIEELLRREYENTRAYEYNIGTIRVRVIDDRFAGKSLGERDAMVSPLLASLPDDLERKIMMLLMLTPEEAGPGRLHGQSLLNLEFDEPSRPLR